MAGDYEPYDKSGKEPLPWWPLEPEEVAHVPGQDPETVPLEPELADEAAEGAGGNPVAAFFRGKLENLKERREAKAEVRAALGQSAVSQYDLKAHREASKRGSTASEPQMTPAKEAALEAFDKLSWWRQRREINRLSGQQAAHLSFVAREQSQFRMYDRILNSDRASTTDTAEAERWMADHEDGQILALARYSPGEKAEAKRRIDDRVDYQISEEGGSLQQREAAKGRIRGRAAERGEPDPFDETAKQQQAAGEGGSDEALAEIVRGLRRLGLSTDVELPGGQTQDRPLDEGRSTGPPEPWRPEPRQTRGEEPRVTNGDREKLRGGYMPSASERSADEAAADQHSQTEPIDRSDEDED